MKRDHSHEVDAYLTQIKSIEDKVKHKIRELMDRHGIELTQVKEQCDRDMFIFRQ